MKPNGILGSREKRVAKPHRPAAPSARAASPGSWIIEAGGTGSGGDGGGDGGGTAGSTVTGVAGVEIGPRYSDATAGSQHTIVQLTPTLADPSLDTNVTFWMQFGDGKWVRQGVWLINDIITSVTLGEQTLDSYGNPGMGNIWVPTNPHFRTWVVAAKEGNVETDEPPAGAPSATFDVPPVDACRTDDCTDIHFVTNPKTSDEMIYVLRDPGVWYWLYFELDWTTPTKEHDPNYWFTQVTVETGYTDDDGVWHSYPDQWGSAKHDDSIFLGRPHATSGDMTGGDPVLGATIQLVTHADDTDLWKWPPTSALDGTPNPWRTVRFRVYAVSRLGAEPGGIGTEGTGGVFTLQPGWPGGEDHFDLTPAQQPWALDLSQANPITSFDPTAPLGGGAGTPIYVAVAAPLSVLSKQITIANNTITDQWLKDGAVTAQKTNLNAINAASGALNANSVIDGLVKLPVGQLIYGSAIFTGNVYLSRGSAQPVIALQNDGIFLYGVASGTGAAGGLTSSPYVAVQNNAIGVFANATGPSVVTTAAGVTIYTVNGSLTQPYTAIAPAALTMKNGNFRLDLTSSQLKFDSGIGAFALLDSGGFRIINGTMCVRVAATFLQLWASWNESTQTGNTAAPFVGLETATGNIYIGTNNQLLTIGSGNIQFTGSGGSTTSINGSFITTGSMALSGTCTANQFQGGAVGVIPFLLTCTTYGSAGSIASYFPITVNGVNYRVPLYNP